MFWNTILTSSLLWSLTAGAGAPPPPKPATTPALAQVVGPCVVGYDPVLVATLARLWQQSPTYRRQCLRLADHQAVVLLSVTPRPGQLGHRAVSTLGRLRNGRLVVQTAIGRREPYAELIVHELEHALEFDEGVNYRQAESRGQAWSSGGGRFETQRAKDAGLKAAQELR